MHRGSAALVGVVFALAAHARDQSGATVELPADIVALIGQNQCALAVKLLKERLDKPDIPVLILAGTMHESGACVAKSWQRAESFYLQAAAGGSRNAAMQLTAGYATQDGHDVGAALWWAHVSNVSRPQACVVPGFNPSTTPEAFVEEIRQWGTARAEACAYTAGLMSSLISDAFYPLKPLRSGELGDVHIVFSPASGVFTASHNDGARLLAQGQWNVVDTVDRKDDLLGYVRNATLRSAHRFTIPSGVPEDWKVSVKFTFRPQ